MIWLLHPSSPVSKWSLFLSLPGCRRSRLLTGGRSQFEHCFKGLSLYLGAKIWIRIRITEKVGSGSGSASALNKNLDTYPYEIKIRIRIRIPIRIWVISRIQIRIWIRIKVIRIHNTASKENISSLKHEVSYFSSFILPLFESVPLFTDPLY